jgi:dihydroflavonol-4-reductase
MIAVTGANGLLGSFIVRKLIERSQPFVALVRKGSDVSLLNDVASSITWRNADVLDPVSLDEAFAGVTHVIHAAAMVSFSARNARKLFDINVQGTRNVVHTCQAHAIKRLVHISSVAALGRQRKQQYINEGNQWIASNYNSAYAESKYLAELEVFRAQEEGLSTVIVNPSVILAPANWNRSSAKLFKYVYDEKPFYAHGFVNYVDVRDVVEVVYKLLHSPIERERFIVSAGSISFYELFSAIAEGFNKRTPRIRLNSFFLTILARLEQYRTLFSRSEPLITVETARLAGTEFRYENKKIKEALSFEFQPFKETIEWCCRAYLSKLIAKN